MRHYIKLYSLQGNKYFSCKRNYFSTFKYALKHILRGHGYWFKIFKK